MLVYLCTLDRRTLANIWDEWEKPWTVEQARDRYVMGPEINQSALARDSGLNLAMIRRRSKSQDWVREREKYSAIVRAQTDRKTAEKVSNRLSSELSKTLLEHHKSAKSFRMLSSSFSSVATAATAKEIDKIRRLRDQGRDTEADELSLELQGKLNSLAVPANMWSLVSARSIADERTALGLNLEQDRAQALTIVEREGSVVLDPEDYEELLEGGEG